MAASGSESGSASESASPSAGYELYTRGDEAMLPLGITDLQTEYSAQDYTDISVINASRVGQTATEEFAIHQFKDYTENAAVTLTWVGQTDYAPSASTVLLQIYNRDLTVWETVDSDSVSSVGTDFTLTANVLDVTDYIDVNDVIVSRVYQEAERETIEFAGETIQFGGEDITFP